MNAIIDPSVNLKSNDEFFKGIKRMTITLRRINYIQIDRNGGYIAYIKLIPMIIPTLASLWNLQGGLTKSKFQNYVVRPFLISWLIGIFIFQLLFKPLLWVFKVKRRYTGTFEVGGAYGLRNQNVVKYLTYYFIGVPVLYFKAKLNEKDWEYILKN